jgi:hypothetical protein
MIATRERDRWVGVALHATSVLVYPMQGERYEVYPTRGEGREGEEEIRGVWQRLRRRVSGL